MEKEFDISGEWKILRNLVSIYYKKIKKDISFVIYKEIERMYNKSYSEKQILNIQQGKTANSISVIYNSIYKRFFDITDLNETYNIEKWQNKLSCEDLTRLILLLEKSRQIVEEDRGDHTYIERKISKISDMDFLPLKIIENNRGFKRSKPIDKKDIKSPANTKRVFEKYIQEVYKKFCKENLYFQRQIESYKTNVENFINSASFSYERKINKKLTPEFYSETVEDVGCDYFGRIVTKKRTYDGTYKYFIDKEEVSLSEIQFFEKEDDKEFDIEKFKRTNSLSNKTENIEQEKSKKEDNFEQLELPF